MEQNVTYPTDKNERILPYFSSQAINRAHKRVVEKMQRIRGVEKFERNVLGFDRA